MKKLMMIAAMMLMSTGAFAQEMFIKPMVGGTLTTFRGDVENNKMKVGLVAGAEFGFMFNENMGVTAGLLYAMQGSGIKHADDNYNMDYLNIPILFNYYFIPGLAAKAGVQPGLLVRAKIGDSDVKDYMEKFDLSIPLGLSYEFSDFVIDARYNLGLLNFLKDSHGTFWSGKAYNSVIQLTVGYKIPF